MYWRLLTVRELEAAFLDVLLLKAARIELTLLTAACGN
jgi:hypothetical protein